MVMLVEVSKLFIRPLTSLSQSLQCKTSSRWSKIRAQPAQVHLRSMQASLSRTDTGLFSHTPPLSFRHSSMQPLKACLACSSSASLVTGGCAHHAFSRLLLAPKEKYRCYFLAITSVLRHMSSVLSPAAVRKGLAKVLLVEGLARCGPTTLARVRQLRLPLAERMRLLRHSSCSLHGVASVQWLSHDNLH